MRYFSVIGLAGILTSSAWGQLVISAKSGLVNHTQGTVLLEGKRIEPKAGEFPEIKKGQQLRTELGLAEILLSPGVYLRLAENSAIRMIDNSLEGTRIELLDGSALLEVGEIGKEIGLTLLAGGKEIEFKKRGLFRIQADPAELKVFDGSAVVVADGEPVTIKEGRATSLASVLDPEKFDKNSGDAFHRWAGRRAGYIALANLTAARRVYDSGVNWMVHDWIYNPYFGSFTYLPARGMYHSPWGVAYYSPRTIERLYYRPAPTNYGYDSGFGGGAPAMGSMRGYSARGSMGSYSSGGGSVAAPPPPAAAPAPAGGARSGGGGGGRSGGGGR